MAASEVAELVALATPYVTAAAGMYGGAVLSRTRDKATSGAVGAGVRLLERVFGRRKPDEPLPEPLADVVAHPGDDELVTALKVGIRKALERDSAMLADVRVILAEAPSLSVTQHAHEGGVAFSAGGDVHFHQAPPPVRPQRRIWGNVPARNPGFTGRERLLTALRDALVSDDRAVVQALHGLGGVGKTQLAIEYAHRYADSYDIVWWLNSESATLLGGEFASLAAELSCAPPDAPLDVMRRALLAELRERGRWLLIFDNAEKPEDIGGWLPGGRGHVLITSRVPNWHDLAVPVDVDVFTRTESAATLRSRVPHLSEADADKVAAALDDLPLAVGQAASYMALTDIPSDEYIRLLADRPTEVLDHGKPWSYPRSLAAATILSFDQLRAADPAAAAVAAICAFLAPEPVPADWFPRAAEFLPESLDRQAADPIEWRQIIARLRGSGLIRVSGGTLLMHRLTQAVIRAHLSRGELETARGSAAKVLTANYPGHYQLPATWPAWARLLPHALALDPAASTDAGLRDLVINGNWYLVRRDVRASIDLARHLYDQWRARLGADHVQTLAAESVLGGSLGWFGEFGAARDLEEDTLARRRRVLGEDHPDTLWSAISLGMQLCGLGELEAARDREEDTLARCRQVLGEDDWRTLRSTEYLATILSEMGEYEAARDLHEETRERRRLVQGENHPYTLISAHNVALNLRKLGKYEAARDVEKDVLAWRRRVLGDDNIETLRSANNLADALYGLGEFGAARDLDEDTLARRRRVLGEDHPDTLRSAANLARDLEALGEKATSATP